MFAVYQHLRSLVFGGEEDAEANSNEVPLTKPPIKSEMQKRYFTGVVTSVNDTSGMIDCRVFFEMDTVIGGQRPAVGATVHVCATREHSQAGWRATKVEVTSQWQPEGRSEKEVLIGFVAQLSSTRGVIDCGTEEVVFSPGSGVCADEYKPFVNDRVSVSLLYQDGERMVNEVRPLREKSMTASVSSVLQGYGTIEEDIYFSFFSCARGYRPRVGDSVRVVCVEYQHQKSNWRALSVEPMLTRPEGKRSDVSCKLLVGILSMTQLHVLPTILGPIRELHSSNKQRKALVFKTSIFVNFINKTLFLEIYNCFLLQVFRPSSYSFPSPPPLLHPHSSTLSLWIITECGGSR